MNGKYLNHKDLKDLLESEVNPYAAHWNKNNFFYDPITAALCESSEDATRRVLDELRPIAVAPPPTQPQEPKPFIRDHAKTAAKLLRVSRESPDTPSATTAAKLAARFILKHSITRAELAAHDQVTLILPTATEAVIWRSAIASSIAKNHNTTVTWTGRELRFSGLRKDAEEALRLYVVLTSQVIFAALREIRADQFEIKPYRALWFQTYTNAAADAIVARLEKKPAKISWPVPPPASYQQQVNKSAVDREKKSIAQSTVDLKLALQQENIMRAEQWISNALAKMENAGMATGKTILIGRMRMLGECETCKNNLALVEAQNDRVAKLEKKLEKIEKKHEKELPLLQVEIEKAKKEMADAQKEHERILQLNGIGRGKALDVEM